jgi:hypothetical protein
VAAPKGPVAPDAPPDSPTADSDRDGITNARDAAPYIPEDKDGVDDLDGVPE